MFISRINSTTFYYMYLSEKYCQWFAVLLFKIKLLMKFGTEINHVFPTDGVF